MVVCLTPAMLSLARTLYETTPKPVAVIAAEAGMSPRSVERHARRGGWARLSPSALTPEGLLCSGLGLCPLRAALHRRLYAALERRLELAEAAPVDGTEAGRERAVRTLAALTRTLDKLMDMDRDAVAAAGKPAPSPGREEAPYDVEALRRALSQKLDRLAEARGEEQDVGEG